ncbi:HNH endonuclease signature motif containing protein [Prevotella sp. P6B1]|uniref:HNH endonuclease signature motif containing protein n=1 Tax=Prevotella sp. P6B1 TaxID=1410613 RepID=UPI00068C9160|nr:HNH endonuclease signature motif containing protein [Prevotella sp. P6B1]
MIDFDDYSVSKECDYKGEHYSVRDNGAIMRHQLPGKPKRKLDKVWTFGTLSAETGYLLIGRERVHRIVATAFHGEAPSPEHVVDHIDTNRQNNRPENLRWLTKLENILNNEVTRKKVEMICGSIQAFLENPSLLYGHETLDKNFSWMRRVTKEEAQNCLGNWNNWLKNATPTSDRIEKVSKVDEWIFDNPFMNKVATKGGGYTEMARPASIIPESEPVSETEAEMDIDFDPYELTEADCYKSLTPSALQAPGWRTPTEFPCCPNDVTSDGLKEYKENLKPGFMFSSNKYDKYYVIDRAFHPKNDSLLVLAKNEQEDGYFGTYSVAMIEIKFNKFVHYSVNRFGHESDATKFYKFLIGEYKLTEDEEIMYLDT